MEGVSKHLRNWMLARYKEAVKQLMFKTPETERVALKVIKYTEDREKGLFTPGEG